MNRRVAFIWVFGLLVGANHASAATRPPLALIPAGTYVCISGNSRMMLTLGDMKISETNYTFKAIGGPATSGTYTLAPTGYKWSGDIGAITNAQIVDSGPDATPGDFWFKYKARPTSSPTSTGCQRK